MTEQRLREIEERVTEYQAALRDKETTDSVSPRDDVEESRVYWRIENAQSELEKEACQDIPDLLAEVRRLKKLLEGE